MNVTPDTQTVWIDLSLIDVPSQARAHSPDQLESLAQSMGKDKQLQNIIVVPKGDRYEVIAGIGRTLAAKRLGWEKVRAVVRDGLSPFAQLYVTAAENDEREDVNPFDRAALYKRMQEAGGLDVRGLAKALGKDETVVGRFLSLADMDPSVKESLARARLSMTHLREIMRLNEPNDQISIGEACAKGDWPVKKLKSEVDKRVKDASPGLPPPSPMGRGAGGEADPFQKVWEEAKKDASHPKAIEVEYPRKGQWVFKVTASEGEEITGLLDALNTLHTSLNLYRHNK